MRIQSKNYDDRQKLNRKNKTRFEITEKIENNKIRLILYSDGFCSATPRFDNRSNFPLIILPGSLEE